MVQRKQWAGEHQRAHRIDRDISRQCGLYYLRGLVSLDMGDYDAAVGDFDRAIDLEPESGNMEDFHAVRGYALYQKGMFANALDDFEYLMEQQTVVRPEILFLRAASHEKADQINAAIRDIRECLHADPNNQAFLDKFNELEKLKEPKETNKKSLPTK